MVGRSTQMVQINALQDTLERGEPAVVFVEGEAGIGKTRLAAELALQFHREGTSVLYGRCEEGLTEPYQPWIDIFDQIVRGAPDGMIARSVGMGGTGKVP